MCHFYSLLFVLRQPLAFVLITIFVSSNMPTSCPSYIQGFLRPPVSPSPPPLRAFRQAPSCPCHHTSRYFFLFLSTQLPNVYRCPSAIRRYTRVNSEVGYTKRGSWHAGGEIATVCSCFSPQLIRTVFFLQSASFSAPQSQPPNASPRAPSLPPPSSAANAPSSSPSLSTAPQTLQVSIPVIFTAKT